MPVYLPPGIINSRRTFDQQGVPLNPNRGDIWRERDVNSDLVEQWFWNGTYWLSTRTFTEDFVRQGTITSRSDYMKVVSYTYNIFVTEIRVSTKVGTTGFDASNYWLFYFGTRRTSPSSSSDNFNIGTITLNDPTINIVHTFSTAINTHYAIGSGLFNPFLLRIDKIGTAASLDGASMSVEYRLARK
jgi:hypothetical protein